MVIGLVGIDDCQASIDILDFSLPKDNERSFSSDSYLITTQINLILKRATNSDLNIRKHNIIEVKNDA